MWMNCRERWPVSGLIAIAGDREISADRLESLQESINLSGNLVERSVVSGDHIFIATFLENCPLRERRLCENHDWVVVFAGDIVGCEVLPCEEIIRAISRNEDEFFASLDGVFAVVAFDKREKAVYVISDRRSQQPIYYQINHCSICVSSDLPTFCRLQNGASLSERWLWDSLYFNFPVGDVTFLRGVKRMPPASLLRYDASVGRCSVQQYARPFRKKDTLVDGQEAMDWALEVFSERIPKYYQGADEVACSLTAGWDGRTLLALAPHKNVTAYTYGVEGCRDLTGAREAAKRAGIRHMSIVFDDGFVHELPKWIMETVYLSSGLQNIKRATLPYVYSRLTDCGKRFPIGVSGICLGNEFRGATFVPSLISQPMVDLFSGRAEAPEKRCWSEVLGDNYASFEEHIVEQVGRLREAYGEFRTAEHHLSNVVYWLGPQYYSAQIKIANHFTTVRVPAWDNKVIDLAYSVKMSTLSYSPFLPHPLRESDSIRMQSYILSKRSPVLARLPVRNRRPDLRTTSAFLFHLLHICGGIKNRAFGGLNYESRLPPLENWNYWLNEVSRSLIDGLIFSRDSTIRQYVSGRYLERLQHTRHEPFMIAKLATAEIVNRLIENNWRRFW
jgi:hypothetical protein